MAETAKALYERLAIEREIYIDRAEDCAKYTIPFLFPKKEANGTTKYPTPYQAVGARGVNNLTSKLVLALFPQTHPSSDKTSEMMSSNTMRANPKTNKR